MTYQQWIDKVGYEKAQQVLDHPESTLRMWYSFKRFPRPAQMVKILDRTANAIDQDVWVRAFVGAKATNKTAQGAVEC
ncbi:hypothetical protein H8F06_21600 [Vibrio fluvialis]|uniref:hypothetical protein n=1 Tax=Vibrio fluvialis TaxID=676 RepID=UPI00192B2086|nr:hypothetical protein [Vibrio fluvialis]MBL4297878.1 hypothetical protein [Vibrio fluvialis]